MLDDNYYTIVQHLNILEAKSTPWKIELLTLILKIVTVTYANRLVFKVFKVCPIIAYSDGFKRCTFAGVTGMFIFVLQVLQVYQLILDTFQKRCDINDKGCFAAQHGKIRGSQQINMWLNADDV